MHNWKKVAKVCLVKMIWPIISIEKQTEGPLNRCIKTPSKTLEELLSILGIRSPSNKRLVLYETKFWSFFFESSLFNWYIIYVMLPMDSHICSTVTCFGTYLWWYIIVYYLGLDFIWKSKSMFVNSNYD